MQNIPLETFQNQYIRLEPIKDSDFETLYAVSADKEIWAMHPTPDRYIRERFQLFFDAALNSKGAFLVFDVETNQCIGSSRYYNYDADNKLIMIGYTFLAKSHWGGKFNKAMKQLMLDYAFKYADEVVFEIGKANLISQKAALNIGADFKSETIMAVEGEDKPYFQYNILKEDWKGLDF